MYCSSLTSPKASTGCRFFSNIDLHSPGHSTRHHTFVPRTMSTDSSSFAVAIAQKNKVVIAIFSRKRFCKMRYTSRDEDWHLTRFPTQKAVLRIFGPISGSITKWKRCERMHGPNPVVSLSKELAPTALSSTRLLRSSVVQCNK